MFFLSHKTRNHFDFETIFILINDQIAIFSYKIKETNNKKHIHFSNFNIFVHTITYFCQEVE